MFYLNFGKLIKCINDAFPNTLIDSTMSPKVKTLNVKTFGCARVSGWGLGRVTNKSIIHTDLHQPNNKLVNAYSEHFWCIDEPWANMNSQDSPRLNLGEATTFPLIVLFVPGHGACTQMSFFPRILKLRILKFPKLRLSRLWRPITFFVNLWLRWCL